MARRGYHPSLPEDGTMLWYPYFVFFFPMVLRCQFLKRAGEKPLKGLIPFYGMYKFYNVYFIPRLYWLYPVSWALYIVFSALTGIPCQKTLVFVSESMIYVSILLPFLGCAKHFDQNWVYALFTPVLYPLLATLLAFGRYPYIPKEKLKKKK